MAGDGPKVVHRALQPVGRRRRWAGQCRPAGRYGRGPLARGLFELAGSRTPTCLLAPHRNLMGAYLTGTGQYLTIFPGQRPGGDAVTALQMTGSGLIAALEQTWADRRRGAGGTCSGRPWPVG